MWRISPVSEDWVVKGCHIHIGRVELAVRPDHEGGIRFRPVFSGTPDADVEAAATMGRGLLEDAAFRERLHRSVLRAMAYLMGVTGPMATLARGRLRELRFLLVALDRWEGR